jgi:hypothetical protein
MKLYALLLAAWRLKTNRWRHRLEAIGSPLLKAPPYRVLFLLVLIGLLLISTLPEAAFVLPAIDAVGLDIVTIFAALELRHYLASAAGLLGVAVIRRFVNLLRMNPLLWPYACMWPLIWLRILTGSLKA